MAAHLTFPNRYRPADLQRSAGLALAKESCTTCGGIGWRPLSVEAQRRGRQWRTCNCVLRAIFRVCYQRFRECATDCHISTVNLQIHDTGGKGRSFVWGRKDEEYRADFYLVSKRTLTEEEWAVFKLRYLLGSDWEPCCRRLKMDRGTFFHHVYRIQQKLGTTFRDLKPYALFPLDEYFSGNIQAAEQTHGGLPTGGRQTPVVRTGYPSQKAA